MKVSKNTFRQIYNLTEGVPEASSRFFVWSSQWFYSWPIKIIRGEDEYGWRNIGIVTWAGSIFYRIKFCYDPVCVENRREYWLKMAAENENDSDKEYVITERQINLFKE